MPGAGSRGTFLPSHEQTYGLAVTERDPETSRVTSALCKFCTAFGREENVGGKRKRTRTFKYFTTFRTDLYRQHLGAAHARKWAEYQKLRSPKDKEAFFELDEAAIFKSTESGKVIAATASHKTGNGADATVLRESRAVAPTHETTAVRDGTTAVLTPNTTFIGNDSTGADLTRVNPKASSPEIYRLWRDLYQLDLVMLRVFKGALEKKFLPKLVSLFGYLLLQHDLVASMSTRCPKLIATRWSSVQAATNWLVKNRVGVMQHLNEKKPTCSPDLAWWIFLHAIQAFGHEAYAVVSEMKKRDIVASEQQDRLRNLTEKYCQMSGAEGPFSDVQIQEELAEESCVASGSFILTEASARLYLESLGVWILKTMDAIEGTEPFRSLITGVSRLFVEGIFGISMACESRGAILPPVLPYEVSKINMRQLVFVMETHHEGPTTPSSEDMFGKIGEDFRQFQLAILADSEFEEAMLQSAECALSFEEAWAFTRNKFPLLQQFCGKLASAFPSTSSL